MIPAILKPLAIWRFLWKRKQYCVLHNVCILCCVYSACDMRSQSVCAFVCSCGNKPRPKQPLTLHYRICVTFIFLWYSVVLLVVIFSELFVSLLPSIRFLFIFYPCSASLGALYGSLILNVPPGWMHLTIMNAFKVILNLKSYSSCRIWLLKPRLWRSNYLFCCCWTRESLDGTVTWIWCGQ